MHGSVYIYCQKIAVAHFHQIFFFYVAIRMLSPADVPPLRIAENTAKVST